MSAADSLRQEAATMLAETQRRASALLAIADAIDNAAPPDVLQDARSALVPLRQAARELGMSYDAVRKAAKRANRNENVAGQSYVWRDWVDDRLSGLSVRLPDKQLVSDDSPAS